MTLKDFAFSIILPAYLKLSFNVAVRDGLMNAIMDDMEFVCHES